LTHLYLLENFLHFSQRQTATCWQLGQWNFEALSPGIIGLLQEVQTGSETDLWDKSRQAPGGSEIYLPNFP
jgi:hypothetical protein